MANNVTIEPTAEPVTLDQAKQQCRILHTLDDEELKRLITVARTQVEQLTRRTMLTTTRVLKLDCFPGHIKLLFPPVIAVSSITYLDENGDSQTLASDQYVVSIANQPGVIVPADNVIWPETIDQVDAVTVTYTAGYASVALVPAPLKQAMLLLIREAYENRAMEASKYVDSSVMSLVAPYMLPEYV